MGAPSSQVQPSQSSAPAGKGAGNSPSTPPPLINPIPNNTADDKMITSMSNQPSLGQPNSYQNTVGQGTNQTMPTPVGKGKGA
jgi:hypothetical protein